MKKLFLLRHADSPMNFDTKDIERPLSDFGHKQAEQISQYLKEIDLVLCSSATRTRETLESALKATETSPKTEFIDDLYNANVDTIIDKIAKSQANSVLLIAHNPGIHIAAYELTKNEESDAYKKLSVSYPPCSLTILECDIDEWSQIEKRQNKLLDFVTIGA